MVRLLCTCMYTKCIWVTNMYVMFMRVILKEHFSVWLLQLGHLADDYPITTFSDEIQGSTMQLLKTLKPFAPTRPLRKQPSDSWMLLIHLQKTWESFGFKKPLWLDNLLLSSPGSCTVSKQPVWEIKKISLHAQFFHNYITNLLYRNSHSFTHTCTCNNSIIIFQVCFTRW